MATLVTFHAHPDDEAISTAGVMALAARAGHRVVLVTATRGEHGEPVPGVLSEGEALGTRREFETRRAAEALGVARVEFLGYRDSGMMDEDTNHDPSSFWRADLDEAAGRLAAILAEEQADVLTIYDDHGGYGHPDHIQVHRVGARAADVAGTPQVFEATMNRDAIKALMEAAPELAEEFDDPDDPDAAERRDRLEADTFGSPESIITHAIDVSAVLDALRAAMAAHRSQIAEDSFFLALPDEAFAASFGTEWFIRHGEPRRDGEAMGRDLFAGPA